MKTPWQGDRLIKIGGDMIMPQLTLTPMDIDNFYEAKLMMEKSFAASMKECEGNSDADDESEDVPSIEGILERPDATPVVFYLGEQMVGGAVLIINDDNNNILELLFVNSDCLDRGIGYSAWQEIEKRYPDTRTWNTITPVCLMRNVHFYVNKCGFHIIRVDDPRSDESMFVFRKIMK